MFRASVIITPVGVRPDTWCCIIQFWPPDDEHIVPKHVRAYNKLIIKEEFVHYVG